MRPLWGPLGQSRYVYTLQSIETQQVQCGSVKTYGSIFVVVDELFFRRAQSNLCDRYQFVFDGYCVKIC